MSKPFLSKKHEQPCGRDHGVSQPVAKNGVVLTANSVTLRQSHQSIKYDNKISVLVTGVGGKSVGYQVLACLRYFPDRYRIIGTDAVSFSAGLYEADKAYLVPNSTDKNYFSRLLYICKKEKVKAIIPGSQPELVAISKLEQDFLDQGIIPIINQPELIQNLANKFIQYQKLQELGFNVPKFQILNEQVLASRNEQVLANRNENQLSQISIPFPLIAKPTKDHAGSRNVYIIKDKKELEKIFTQTSQENVEMLIQEYVGSAESEYTVGVISDKNGHPIEAIVLKRKLFGLSLLSERIIDKKRYAISTGLTQGFFVKDEEIRNYCLILAKKLNSRGPLNVQLRKTKQGVVVFEVHARFSGSASQRAAIGFNEPDQIIQNYLSGNSIKKIKYKTDIAVIRRLENVLTPINKLQQVEEEFKQ